MAAKRRQQPKRYYSKTRSKPAKKMIFRRGGVILLVGALAVALLTGLFFGLKSAASFLFSRNENFALRNINITTDGRMLPAQIQEYADLYTGINLFSIDFDSLRSQLEGIPQVESVAIFRQLPDTLTIHVVERVPRAQILWNRRAKPFLLDRTGTVMSMVQNGESLPLIEGMKLDSLCPGARLEQPIIRQCLDILVEADQLSLGDQIAFARFDVHYPDFITAVVNDDITVRFPLHSAREKLVRLFGVLKVAKEQGQRLKTVDLTPDGRNVPVTYYE